MVINPIFFIGYFAGALQVIAILYGYRCIQRAIQEHNDRKRWAHIKRAV